MTAPSVRCRDIVEADLPGVVDLLTLGFRDQRDRGFWQRGIERLRRRAVPEGFPRYGCLMESEGRPVGVILQIFAPVAGQGVRCNFSSWWVMPAFRAFGALLVSRAFRHKVTYTNITPAPQTLPILEAQGYRLYCAGRMIGMPALRAAGGVAVRAFDPPSATAARLAPEERAILADHAAWDGLCLVGLVAGAAHPFVFVPRRRLGLVNLAVLAYAGAGADVARCAPALGRHLLRRGFPLMVIDADGPMPGFPGRYRADKPKYYRGPDRPRLHDHAYSERAIFGS